MQQHRLKRRAIELEHLEAWFSQGRAGFHFENCEPLRAGLGALLRLTGLSSRGERNCCRHVRTHTVLRCVGLPGAFEGFTILHLSDLHADGLPGLAAAISRQIHDQDIDLCVLTGDYRFEVSGPCHNVYPAMQEIINAVHARHGIIGILGNHDFYEEAEALERMGVRMLINDSTAVERGSDCVWIAGVDDPHYYACDDLGSAMADIPPGAFVILLAHSPELYREAQRCGVSLYLCGHTHGGQLCLPLLGPVLLNADCPRSMCAGAWTYKGMDGYTSAGAGSSMVAARFLCPPEITVLELRSPPN